jgi:hypothetical protein
MGVSGKLNMLPKPTHHADIQAACPVVFSVGGLRQIRPSKEAKTSERKRAKPKSSRVWQLPYSERRLVDVGLAIGHGPGYLARRFLNLKRHQSKHHHDACLGGAALLHEARRRGWLDESGAGSAREDAS